MIPSDTNAPSSEQPSPSVDYIEVPNLLKTPVPVKEMSDAQLQEFYNKVRDITTSPQSLAAHLRLKEPSKTKTKPQADISRYV